MKRQPEEKRPLGNVRPFISEATRCNAEVISKLEWLLERARSGEITGIHGIADCGPEYFTYSTAGLSNLQAAGALLDAAISRLGYKQ